MYALMKHMKLHKWKQGKLVCKCFAKNCLGKTLVWWVNLRSKEYSMNLSEFIFIYFCKLCNDIVKKSKSLNLEMITIIHNPRPFLVAAFNQLWMTLVFISFTFTFFGLQDYTHCFWHILDYDATQVTFVLSLIRRRKRKQSHFIPITTHKSEFDHGSGPIIFSWIQYFRHQST